MEKCFFVVSLIKVDEFFKGRKVNPDMVKRYVAALLEPCGIDEDMFRGKVVMNITASEVSYIKEYDLK